VKLKPLLQTLDHMPMRIHPHAELRQSPQRRIPDVIAMRVRNNDRINPRRTAEPPSSMQRLLEQLPTFGLRPQPTINQNARLARPKHQTIPTAAGAKGLEEKGHAKASVPVEQI